MCERKCSNDFSGWGKLNYTLRDDECPEDCPRCINDMCKEVPLEDIKYMIKEFRYLPIKWRLQYAHKCEQQERERESRPEKNYTLTTGGGEERMALRLFLAGE